MISNLLRVLFYYPFSTASKNKTEHNKECFNYKNYCK